MALFDIFSSALKAAVGFLLFFCDTVFADDLIKFKKVVTNCENFKIVQAKFMERESMYVTLESREGIQIIPTKYNYIFEKIMIQEKYHHGDIIEEIEEVVVVKEFDNRIAIVEATFKELEDQVIVVPEYEFFRVNEMGGIDRVIVPAEVMSFTRRVVDRPDSTWQKEEAKTETRKISVTRVRDASGTGGVVPARFMTIQRRTIERPISVRRVFVPGKADSFREKVISSPARVVCEDVFSKF